MNSYLDIIGQKLQQNKRYFIGFVGDSLTSCEWVHPNWREIVEYVLKEELQKRFEDWRIPYWGIRCFNFGYDGATTKDINDKLEEILSIKPDLILGLMGGNDPVLGLALRETENNLDMIFRKLEENEVETVWSTSLPDLRGNKNMSYEPYRQATLRAGGDQVVDGFEWLKQFDLSSLFTFVSEENEVEGIKEGETDPIHPNQLGNAYVAKMFLEKMEIVFDPEKYIKTTLKGNKYPGY